MWRSSTPRTTSVVSTGVHDDRLLIEGFKSARLRSFVSHLISVLTLGLPYLLMRWRPTLKLRLQYTSCALRDAQLLLVSDLVVSDEKEEKRDATIVYVHSKVIKAEDHLFDPFALHERHNDHVHNDDVQRDEEEARLLPSLEEGLLDTRVPCSQSSRRLQYFHYKHQKYVYVVHLDDFVPLSECRQLPLLPLRALSDEERDALQLLYGSNCMSVEVKSYLKLLFEEVLNPFYVFQVFSIVLWSLDEYLFYASCIFLISLASIVLTLVETRRQSRKLHDMVAASNTVDCVVQINKDEVVTEKEVRVESLVPGDVLVLPRRTDGFLLPCDAVLISGTCIVNEAMLTGEAMPVTKNALNPHNMNTKKTTDTDEVDDDSNLINYDSLAHDRHTLYAGTCVLQTRFYEQQSVLAVVTRVGFNTAKGELIRSILHPKAHQVFKFYKDSARFITLLFFIATFGMALSVYLYIARGADVYTIVLRALDIITIVVPPALPAAMTVGSFYAQSRLKKLGIFCIAPNKINVGGKVKMVCFDKTGTLTEEGLDFKAVVMSDQQSNAFEERLITDPSTLRSTNHPSDESNRLLIVTCLATCHSLTVIQNQLIGDPLDLKMFEATGFELNEPGHKDSTKFDMLMPTVVSAPIHKNGGSRETIDQKTSDARHEVGKIREFDFVSSLARMSVITRTLNSDHFDVFVKGAPEQLENLCPSLPQDYHEKLHYYTSRGFRVLALAHKRLASSINWLRVQRMRRHEVESDLTFLGLLIMENKLKSATKNVIKELNSAQIRLAMVTGDNLLTALSVARGCDMIARDEPVVVVEMRGDNQLVFRMDEHPEVERHQEEAVDILAQDLQQGLIKYHMAMTGETLNRLHHSHPSLLSRLVTKCTVFARMAPEEKAWLVNLLQKLDYICVFAGDGANDCGALKNAHVGISLSVEAECSVAAPFTSTMTDIRCVVDIMREGRCALVTSFGLFKYMALYSLIQFVTVLLLYSAFSNLGDTQFLYIDLVITSSVAVLMGWTQANPRLERRRPHGSLMSPINLVSLVLQLSLVLGLQLLAYGLLQTMKWFTPVVIEHKNDPDSDVDEGVIVCWENLTLFTVSSFQYLILAFAFSKGPPFRKPFYTNKPFLYALLILTIFTIVLTTFSPQLLADFFEIETDNGRPLLHFKFKALLLAIVAFHLAASLLVESELVVESRWLKRLMHLLTGKRQFKNAFKNIEHSMLQDPTWPPINQSLEKEAHYSSERGLS